LRGIDSANGWDYWHYVDESGSLVSIDALRERYRQQVQAEAD